MAFIRKETKKSGTYLRFVESYRDAEGKSKHRTLYNLGRAEDYSPESLKRMGQVLYELGGGKVEEIENKQLKEIGRYNYGFPLVVRKLFKEYALDGFLQRRINTKGLGFNLADSVSLLICERLHDPVVNDPISSTKAITWDLTESNYIKFTVHLISCTKARNH